MDGTGCKAEWVYMSDVQPQRLEWLWPERFPLGKLTLLVGDADNGKSFVTLSMASAISRGAPWPDRPGIPQPVGGVVMLSAEDDPHDTIRPRLDALGADCKRVALLQSLSDVGRDIEQLREVIDDVENCRLVVIDPASAFMGKVDTHKDADVRRVLTPLAKLAAEKRVALVLVMHLNKRECDAMYRTSGSIAFVAAARAVWAVSADLQNPQRRTMTLLKNNLSGSRTGLAYRIEEMNGEVVFTWEAEPVKMTASEALQPRKRGPAAAARNRAADWLRGVLANGPKLAREVVAAASAAGFSKSTIYRALPEIGGKHDTATDGGALWSLPAVSSDGVIEQLDNPEKPETADATWNNVKPDNLDKPETLSPIGGNHSQDVRFLKFPEAGTNLRQGVNGAPYHDVETEHATAADDPDDLNRELLEADPEAIPF